MDLRLLLLASLGCAWAADDGGDYDRNLASFGAWGHPVPLELQAQDGLSPGEGIVVRWVRPGGPADQMGVKPGDVILSLNGNAIGSRLDLRNTVLANAPGSAAEAVVVHPGGDVAVLDGTFGERRTNRPIRPLTDQWEQEVKQAQLEELDRRARELQQLNDEAAALDPGGTAGGAEAANANGQSAVSATETSAASANAAAAAADPARAWFVSHRWSSPEQIAAPASARASAPPEAAAANDGERPWRLAAVVPGTAEL